MHRFARSAALVGVVALALVLALAASATTSKTDRGAAPSAGAAVTNYLTYVHGKRGKADPKKSKILIGWVNQQGGQVVIGGLATAGAELAVRYVNDQLGGVGGHPVALVECFIKSNEEEGTTCGQKLVNNKRISVIATGAVATGAQSLHATIRGRKPVVTGVAVTPVDGASKTAVVLFGDGPHILLPFGNYAKNVLKAKTAAVIYPNAPGLAESGQVIAAGLKAAGIDTKQVGYTQGQSDLTAP
jgi:branched-chain amino acid transport system substrate-binding protein